MLDKIRQNYPIGAIILLLLSNINFEYHSESPAWSAYFPGTAVAIFVMCVIGLILLYRIVDALHAIAVVKGYLPERVRYKYDILLLVGLGALILQSQFFGGSRIERLDGSVGSEWELQWTNSELTPYYIVSLIVLVLLLRVSTILTAMVRHAQQV